MSPHKYDARSLLLPRHNVLAPFVEEVTNSSINGSIKLRVTSDGGYYVPIKATSNQIGQMFRNLVTIPDSSDTNQVVGSNEGYSFLFPKDDFASGLPLGNRYFSLDGDEGGTLVVINEAVVHGTGGLRKYVGATLLEEVVSTDPHYVADITLTVPPPKVAGDELKSGPSNFLISAAEGGLYIPMLIGDNSSDVGGRFWDIVYDKSNVRIGT